MNSQTKSPATRLKFARLTQERRRIEKHTLRIGPMTMGSLIEHYKKCGKPTCSCTTGKLHGPYWYLAYKKDGKSVLQYVASEELARGKKLAANYKQFQSNLSQIRKLNSEILHLLGQIRAARLREGR